MFLKNRNISSKIKISKVTDYAAISLCFAFRLEKILLGDNKFRFYRVGQRDFYFHEAMEQ